MRFYFAYGLNLDRQAMAGRCPAARPVGPAMLQGQRFVINRLGLATVVPDRRSAVHGLLWRVSPADERALDRFESVETGLYQRDQVRVRLAPGRPVRQPALVYRAGETRPGPPRPGYLEAVLAAAEELGLPADYLAFLRTLAG